MGCYPVKIGLLNPNNWKKLPEIQHAIIAQSVGLGYNSKLSGNPLRPKTLSLVHQSFNRPLKRSDVNGYVDGCELHQGFKCCQNSFLGCLNLRWPQMVALRKPAHKELGQGKDQGQRLPWINPLDSRWLRPNVQGRLEFSKSKPTMLVIKAFAQKTFGTLKPPMITTRLWTDIRYNLIVTSPLFYEYNIILTMMYRL